MHLITLTLTIFFSIILPTKQATATFCSVYCGTNTCTSPWPTDCNTYISPFALSLGSCVVTGQNTIFTEQLLMYNTFTPVGYQSSSSLSVIKCTGLFDYYMLGSLGSNSYVKKTFSGLGINHYQVTVYYGYAIMSPTTWTRPLLLQLIDETGTTTNDTYTPNCVLDGLVGCLWSLGCYKNYAKTVAYSSNSLTLNFVLATALTTGQAWGIRDIVIVLAKCDASCATCTAGAATNCLTCAAGLYFSGTRCISQCAYYTMIDSKQCVISCPSFYYLNAINNFCEACPSGCNTCTSYTQCISWDQNSNPTNMPVELMAVWIIAILIGLFLVGLLVWKCCISKKTYYSSMEEDVIDHKPVEPQKQKKNTQIAQSHEVIDAHWIEDIDDLHMTRAGKRKAKDSIDGIGNGSNQIQ